MTHDAVVEEIDLVRRSLLKDCEDDLHRLMDRITGEASDVQLRLSSIEELNRLFPSSPIDFDHVAALGEPWRDEIVEEVHRTRDMLAGRKPSSAKSNGSRNTATTTQPELPRVKSA